MIAIFTSDDDTLLPEDRRPPAARASVGRVNRRDSNGLRGGRLRTLAAALEQGRMHSLAPRFEAAGLDIEEFRPLFSAPRSAMRSLLEHLDERHGAAARYLVDVGGMAPDVTTELHRKLVGP